MSNTWVCNWACPKIESAQNTANVENYDLMITNKLARIIFLLRTFVLKTATFFHLLYAAVLIKMTACWQRLPCRYISDFISTVFNWPEHVVTAAECQWIITFFKESDTLQSAAATLRAASCGVTMETSESTWCDVVSCSRGKTHTHQLPTNVSATVLW